MTLTKRNNSSLGHLLITVHLKCKFNDVPVDDMWQYWLIIRTHDQFNWLLTYSLYVCCYPNVIQLVTSPMYFQLMRHFNTLYMTVCRSRQYQMSHLIVAPLYSILTLPSTTPLMNFLWSVSSTAMPDSSTGPGASAQASPETGLGLCSLSAGGASTVLSFWTIVRDSYRCNVS